MLGKSGLVLLAFVACAHNVPQDKATGADGKIKGAKEMRFENGEAKSEGIVTYPGGDRIDWKSIELPEKKIGALELTLTWRAPRPKLQLSFDVFDEWGYEVVSSKKTSKKKQKGPPKKTASVPNARGKYYVRVFAQGRGDAGKYTLTAEFTEAIAGPGFDPLTLEVNDPPRLASVPEAEVPCDEFAFDPKNKACQTVCPKTGAPPGWPACEGKCPTPPDVNIPACLGTMECPAVPDRKIAKCRGKFPKCPDPKNPDPNNPNCDDANVDPVTARILKSAVNGDGVTITVGAGTASGIGKGWTGVVLRGDSEQALAPIQVVRLDKNIVVGVVKLTVDQVTANPRAKFSPPPRSK